MKLKITTLLLALLITLPAAHAFQSMFSKKAEMSLEALALASSTGFDHNIDLDLGKKDTFIDRVKLKFLGIVELDENVLTVNFKRIDEKRAFELGINQDEKEDFNANLEEINMLLNDSIYESNDMLDAISFWQVSLQDFDSKTVRTISKLLTKEETTFKRPFGY